MNTVKAFLIIPFILFFFQSCLKEYSYERGPVDSVALYSLSGSPTVCINAQVVGSYTVGVPLTTTNFIRVQVDVSSVGSYSITTGSLNGMIFSDTGHFTTNGIQEIVIVGKGTPEQGGITSFPVSGGNSTCHFDVPVAPAPVDPSTLNRSDSAWQFNKEQNKFHGYFDGALIHNINGNTVVTLVGLTSTKDTAISILIDMGPAAPIKTGIYTSTKNLSFSFFDYSGATIYAADNRTAGVELTLIVTAYDATTKVIEGSFSGTALTRSNEKLELTKGKFKARLT